MDRDLRIRMLLQLGDKVTKPLRDMAAGSSRANQALKATRDRLAEIKRAQANIAGFRELKAGLRSTEAELHATQTRVADLARKMAAADTPTKKLAAEFAKAKREASALKDSFEGQSAKLQQMRDRLAAAGVSTSSLVGHERRLREEAARTNAELGEQERKLTTLAARSKRFSAARESFGRIQGQATGLAAGGASSIAVGLSVGRPLLATTNDASEFESSMTTIAQKANLSRIEAVKMGAGLLVAARAANQLPEAIQQGVDTLAGFGLDPRKAVAMMRPIGRAATAYKAEIADLSAAAFAANDNLKVPVEQTARVIDIMAEAGKAGAFEIKDMAGAFPALTAGYQALGQTGTGAVADLSAALQIARKGAGDSATAANNVANLINKIASPATIKAFSKFGIDLPKALKKAYTEGKTPLEAIAELTKKATGGDLGKIGFLFEDAQVQQGLRPIIQNLEEYRRIRKLAGGASGTTDRDFAERMGDAAEKSKKLEVNAKALSITLGNQLQPTANGIRDRLSEVAEKTNQWAQRNPGLTKTLLIGAAVLAGLFLILGVGGIAIAAIFGPIAILNAGLIAMGVAGGLASIGLLPIIGIAAAVVAGIALLAGVAYLLYNNWGAISSWFAGIWSELKAGANNGITGILGVMLNFSPVGIFYRAFAGVLSYLGIDIPARLTDLGGYMVRALINGISGVLPSLRNISAMMMDGLLSLLNPARLALHMVNLGKTAITAFKNVLGIHSPSRVFAELGGHVTGGLALGIDRGGAAPVSRLDALSRQMTAAIAVGTAVPGLAIGAVDAGGARGAGSQQTQTAKSEYHFHIVQQPGEDANALAIKVREQIEQIERDKAARARSSFADTPDWEGDA